MPDLPDDPIRARVDELLDAMTPAEKAGQLTQYFVFPAAATEEGDASARSQVDAAIEAGEVGSLLFVTDPREINRLQRRVVAGNRHGLPALFGFDVIHGFRTVFPVPIAMAATWDPALVERGQAVAAREARAVGIHWAFAPMVDVARDPRWGRMVEGAGEDPYLGALVAAAQVRGFQGEAIGTPDRVIAGPKHFAGYGFAVGGRDYDEVDLSDSALRNVVLPPFRAAIEAGAGNVMSAYMDLNGVPASGDRRLLTDLLRDELGFAGFVVSDANAVRNLVTHGFAKDARDAAARALHAGTDMEMAIEDAAFASLPAAVEAGEVDGRALDDAVRRVLEVKLRLGIVEDPIVDEARAREVLDDPEHREAARGAAERSAVLLKNDGGVLPLDPGVRSIAVVGPLADSARATLGPWVFDFDLDETSSVLEGIRARAGDGVRVESSPGVAVVQRAFPSIFDRFPGNTPADPEGFDPEAEFDRAVRLAAEADVAVVVLGEWQNQIGEQASRSSLDLPGRQLELLQAVVATGTPTVLLLMSGRPLDLRWAAEHVPAILEIWYPGTRGAEAVARLLFGDAEPGGRLPFTWPRSVGQVPIPYAHTASHEPENQGGRYWDEASTPLFPFGHGLGYGTVELRGLEVTPAAVPLDGEVGVAVEVVNTGERETAALVQLYLHQRYGSASRPVRELKGFARVVVPGGGATRVELTIGPEERGYWSAASRAEVVEASAFDVWVGVDAGSGLHGGFEVTSGG